MPSTRAVVRSPPGPSRLEQLLTFDRLYKLPSLNLRKLDHLSMPHAVEGRVPYCQPEVTRFARHTPDAGKVDGARRKGILVEAATALASASVLERAKQPFTFPVTAFMEPGSRYGPWSPTCCPGPGCAPRATWSPPRCAAC